MSASRGAWISKRGQSGADSAIDQVLDCQPGEPVLQLADAQIEDSPYQARRPFTDTSVAELAQGMCAVGFQGVLIVRPHPDPTRRREGQFQLAYGHRRRAAWRRVCAERGEACLLPVVVRELSDERMLTIGAQENLQRADLDPIEEAQIVDWHQRMFSDKNQAEIGQMLGKSSDWVSVRARVHRLPEALKARLRERPRAIGQMLEIAGLYAQHPELTVVLADRVVQENLTLETVRALVRVQRPDDRAEIVREIEHNRRVNATSVPKITIDKAAPLPPPHREASQGFRNASQEHTPASTTKQEPDTPAGMAPTDASREAREPAQSRSPIGTDESLGLVLLIQEVVLSLDTIAAQAGTLPMSAAVMHALNQVDQAVVRIRRAMDQ